MLLSSLPPPRDAFHLDNHEDFVHRLRSGDLRQPRPFFAVIRTGYAGMDPHHRDVYVKAVPSHSDEREIMKYLTSGPLRGNTWNSRINFTDQGLDFYRTSALDVAPMGLCGH